MLRGKCPSPSAIPQIAAPVGQGNPVPTARTPMHPAVHSDFPFCRSMLFKLLSSSNWTIHADHKAAVVHAASFIVKFSRLLVLKRIGACTGLTDLLRYRHPEMTKNKPKRKDKDKSTPGQLLHL